MRRDSKSRPFPFTHKELLDSFFYDPDVGQFLYKKTSRRMIAGQAAGCDHKTGYRRIGIKGRLYLEHRLAWFYFFKEEPPFLDHINGIKNDNRI